MRRISTESSGIIPEAIRTAKRHARIAVGALAIGGAEPGCVSPEACAEAERVVAQAPADVASETAAPGPTYHPDGSYSPAERRERTRVLSNGAELLDDAGVFFYRVRPGDTLSGISATLARDPQFSYLRDRGYGVASYNADPKRLYPGMWLPIPAEREAYVIDESEFLMAAERAVTRMERHPAYGERVRTLLSRVSRHDVIASMLAVAKVESGGRALGELSLARWEPTHNVFSFSLFHVLMEGAGLRARKNLGLTEGQLFQPENGAALFLAFLLEKGDPGAVLPVGLHADGFSTFYNGAKWKTYNPTYADDIRSAYREAKVSMIRSSQDTSQATSPPRGGR